MKARSVASRIQGQWMPGMHLFGLCVVVLIAGCASVQRSPAQESGSTTAPSALPAAGPAAKPPVKLASPAAVKPAAKKEPAASLDLKSLEKRLRETNAIGTFTKLALKNQVDDLLDQFRAYHQGREKTTLAELRQPYDLLLLKVLSLLQDGDPALARDIVASREAIWSVLADRNKFNTVS